MPASLTFASKHVMRDAWKAYRLFKKLDKIDMRNTFLIVAVQMGFVEIAVPELALEDEETWNQWANSNKDRLEKSIIKTEKLIGLALMDGCRKDPSCPTKALLPEYDLERPSIKRQ